MLLDRQRVSRGVECIEEHVEVMKYHNRERSARDISIEGLHRIGGKFRTPEKTELVGPDRP